MDEAKLLKSVRRAVRKAGPPRILIIDDDKELLHFMRLMFENKGIQVTTASTGVSGVRSFELSNPDVIILDVVMPSGDGFFVVDKLAITESWISPISPKSFPSTTFFPTAIFGFYNRGSTAARLHDYWQIGFEDISADCGASPAATSPLLASDLYHIDQRPSIARLDGNDELLYPGAAGSGNGWRPGEHSSRDDLAR